MKLRTATIERALSTGASRSGETLRQKMLSRVEIENFRGFSTYKMNQLARVNLLVGKNNSGKTALLEGIQLLTSRGDPSALLEAAHRRGELIISGPNSTPLVDIAHIFHGHTLSLNTQITLRGDNGYNPIVMKIFERSDSPESAKGRASHPGYYFKISGPSKSDRDEPRFLIAREGGVDFDIAPYRLRSARAIRRTSSPQVRFVGPDSLSSVELAAMWDEITIRGQEVDIAAAMRVIDDQLESVHFLTGMFSAGYFPSRGGIVAGIQGQEGRVPLGSLGDGMRRLMSLATSLAFTREGCLFIDEIDTGLHYSIMPDMWKLVLSKAISSNSQVFATTHSWDCIEGLKSLFYREPELMSSVAIHKIDHNLSHSVAFAEGSLERLVKSDIDPR